MESDDKFDETRVIAGEILALSVDDVARLFYSEMKQRKLARLVRRLDALTLAGGEDGRIATLALERLGFPVDAALRR